MAYINIDIEDYLEDVSTRYILNELNRRRERGDKESRVIETIAAMRIPEILKDLRSSGCPDEICNLVERWANRRLSLQDLLELSIK